MDLRLPYNLKIDIGEREHIKLNPKILSIEIHYIFHSTLGVAKIGLEFFLILIYLSIYLSDNWLGSPNKKPWGLLHSDYPFINNSNYLST